MAKVQKVCMVDATKAKKQRNAHKKKNKERKETTNYRD